MKQMQIYVSMPSFNMSDSKDWHRSSAGCFLCICVGLGASQCLYSCTCVCKGACTPLALGCVCASVYV